MRRTYRRAQLRSQVRVQKGAERWLKFVTKVRKVRIFWGAYGHLEMAKNVLKRDV